MSEVQVAVKWLFGNVGNYCKFVDFKNLFLNCVLFLFFINTLPTYITVNILVDII